MYIPPIPFDDLSNYFGRSIDDLKAETYLRLEALTEQMKQEMVELLTTPVDLATYKVAITEALYKGTKRNVESESDPKNAVVE